MNSLDQLRIRGRGVGLKMVLRAEKPFGSACGCRGMFPTPDGAWEADMGVSGKMLFVPLGGGFKIDSPWNVEKNEYDRLEIDFLPDKADVYKRQLVNRPHMAKTREKGYASVSK